MTIYDSTKCYYMDSFCQWQHLKMVLVLGILLTSIKNKHASRFRYIDRPKLYQQWHQTPYAVLSNCQSSEAEAA